MLKHGACLEQDSGYTIEVLYPVIELTTAPNTGFAVGVRLQEHCEPVASTSDFVFEWTVNDPSIVELSTADVEPTSAELRGLDTGETTLRLVVRRRDDGVEIAQATMEVTVTPESEN